MATTVVDAASNQPWTGTETTGASAHDTAVVSGAGGIAPTGTVTYRLFANGGCSGTSTPAGTVTLGAGGAAPASDPTGPLAAGDSGFQATYSGDASHAAATSSCEPFSVQAGTPVVATTVVDAATNQPWTGTETTGSSAHDTAVVSGAGGITPTGTVSYRLFANGVCSGTPTPAGTVTVGAGGAAPASAPTGPLSPGDNAFQATYSGDTNYAAATSRCEPFSVQAPTSQVVQADTTCQQFAAGTSTPLTAGHYSIMGTTINGINPGVFSYYTQVTAPSAGFTSAITQTNDSGTTPPYESVPINNRQVTVFDNSCGVVNSGVTVSFPSQGDADITITQATPGAVYIIAVKYSLTSLTSVPPKNPLTFTFSTDVNSLLVPGSPANLPFQTP